MKCCKKAYRESNRYCGLFRCPCLEESCRFYGEMTKADRIRAMSDEELEAFLINVDLNKDMPFITDWGKWLKLRVED